MNFSDSGDPLKELRNALSLGRKMRSAPTPSLRFSEPSIKPRVRPTRVRIRVTCRPISRMLSRVRTGRKRTFSQTSLKTTLFRRSDDVQLRSLGLIQNEFVVGQREIHLHVDDFERHAVSVLQAIDIDVGGKLRAVVLLPFRIAGIADDRARARFIVHGLPGDAEIDAVEP